MAMINRKYKNSTMLSKNQGVSVAIFFNLPKKRVWFYFCFDEK